MPAYISAPEDLVLHGPRVMGFVSAPRVAVRFGLDPDMAHELLLDFEASGWVQHSSFGGSSGWSMTDAGRTENERRLAVELGVAGVRDAVSALHTEFVPLNRRFGTACSDWQIRPTRIDPMAFNDHTDWTWDEQVLRMLTFLGQAFAHLCIELTACLERFDGYADRYSYALAKVNAGQRRWVDAPELDSCHTVWIQFHEDLLATLGIPRGSDA
ncbi:MAG: transcriptional regulator [Actinomycetota bacterium]